MSVKGVNSSAKPFIIKRQISPATLLMSEKTNVAPMPLPLSFWYLELKKKVMPKRTTAADISP
jgi:hypothetical protein